MKIEAIKNINITISFSSSLNHLLISQKDLLELFKTGDPQKDLHTFIEAPGLKVLIFPNRQKDIVFEANRVLVNEKTGVRPEESKIIDNFQKIKLLLMGLIMMYLFFQRVKISILIISSVLKFLLLVKI